MCVSIPKTYMADLVLYVGYDRRDSSRSRFCPGSRLALEVIDDRGMQERVTVQSIDALRESMPALPDWLRGTPTLVCRGTRKAMRGTAAVDHLRSLPGEEGDEESAQGGGKGGGGKGGAGSAEHGLDGMVVASERAFLGAESNFEPIGGGEEEDASKYDDSRKVTENDLQRLIERRKASVPPA